MNCLICTDTTVWYFDVHKPITIKVDASQKGLVATLLQDGYPVTFALNVLTLIEQCYDNIEYPPPENSAQHAEL